MIEPVLHGVTGWNSPNFVSITDKISGAGQSFAINGVVLCLQELVFQRWLARGRANPVRGPEPGSWMPSRGLQRSEECGGGHGE